MSLLVCRAAVTAHTWPESVMKRFVINAAQELSHVLPVLLTKIVIFVVLLYFNENAILLLSNKKPNLQKTGIKSKY